MEQVWELLLLPLATVGILNSQTGVISDTCQGCTAADSVLGGKGI